jgi:hypothetical protein
MKITGLYMLAESKNINIFARSLSASVSMSFQDDDGDCHIAVDPLALGSVAEEFMYLGHEMGHCMTREFYTAQTNPTERNRVEYRADQWAVHNLVPFRRYRKAILAGCRDAADQADAWGVPISFVPTIHTVYERTRWDDVQRLKQQILDNEDW